MRFPAQESMLTTFHYPESPYGRTYTDVITNLGWIVYQIILVMVLRSRALGARKETTDRLLIPIQEPLLLHSDLDFNLWSTVYMKTHYFFPTS